jgi:hypothetical protein
MKCPNCDSDDVRVEGSGRSCQNCSHIWEKEDDGKRPTVIQSRRVFCPRGCGEMDPTRRTCSDCGAMLQ